MAEKTGPDFPTEEEIDKMKLGKLTRFLREEFGMTEDQTEEMETSGAREELKKRIKQVEAEAATRRRPGQAAENLTEILDSHKKKRDQLVKLCHNIAAYHLKLDDSIKVNLKTQFGREAEDIFQYVQSCLGKEECRLLVAGEISSGKSTFLNLLLGENILPVAHESSTSTVCEVTYGETKQAVIHLRDPNDEGEMQITIPLDGTEEHRQKLKRYIHLEDDSRDKLSQASCIQIFWPLPLLKGGIVIVDSPGVGESEKMDKFVADYIPKAFTFVYVIDSYRAGGVQQDRLGKLLDLYAKQENEKNFDSESAMFISNKLDLVPADEQDKLKRNTFRKLRKMWPGLKKSQLFFVSTKKAVGPGGILSEDFCKVLDGLDLLLPRSLYIKLDTQFRLLTELLSATLKHIKVRLNVARLHLHKDAKMKKYQEVKKYLQSFEDRETQGMVELESMLTNNIKSTKDFVLSQVQNGKLRKDLMAVEKLPVIVSLLIPAKRRVKHQDVFAELVHDKRGEDFSRLKSLYEALADTLAHCPAFEVFIDSLEPPFKSSLNEVVKSVVNAQQQAMAFITGSSYTARRMDALFHTPFLETVYDTFFRGVTMSSLHWPERWSMAHSLEWETSSSTESILQSYWNKAHIDSPLVDILIQALSSDDLLTELAERQMQPKRDLLSKMKEGIKTLRDIMYQTIDQTLKDARSNDEILQTYEPLSRDINGFLGQLAMFHLTSTKRYEYDLDSIMCQKGSRYLGGGSFGAVHRVLVSWKGAETPAALKLGVYRHEITTHETAWEFLQEEENLRKLKGDHIVEYYGTACQIVKKEGQPDSLRLGLVMELCECSLEERIIAKTDRNPAWCGTNPEKLAAAFNYTQNLAVQLCEGLKTIHDTGYIHRDLKLTNILVTRDNTVKIADVGLTKREEKITGTVAGTPVYIAPEVWERKKYDKSADIYSLGLILWEMWYGMKLQRKNLAEMEEYLKNLKEGKDIKMPPWNNLFPPIPELAKLIYDCIKKDTWQRPMIQDCLDRISAMKIE